MVFSGGETVHIKATVVRQCGGDVFIQVDFHPYPFQGWVVGDLITHVEPSLEPLKVGESVRLRGCKFGGAKIVALSLPNAWIVWPLGDHCTFQIDDLERVDPGTEVGQ